jgi:general secretion pathway protein C
MARACIIIFNLLALSAMAYIGVDIYWRVANAGPDEVHPRQEAVQAVHAGRDNGRPALGAFRSVTQRNLFGASVKREGPIQKIENLNPTSLGISLMGTVTGNPSYAVIEDGATRKQGLYRVGDSIQNAVVKMILKERVVLSVGGSDEVLVMEPPKSSKARKRPRAGKARTRARPTPRTSPRPPRPPKRN